MVVAGGNVLVRGVSDLSTIQNGPNGLGVMERLHADGSRDTFFGQNGESGSLLNMSAPT